MERKLPGMAFIVAMAMFALLAANASAQYKETDFVSNQPGVAPLLDPDLVNGWGLTRTPTSPFWVSDNVTGESTLYRGNGAKPPLTVIIPRAPGNTTGTHTGTQLTITVLTAHPG